MVKVRAKNDVQGVDDTRNVTQDGQQDVDAQVGAAATLEEDTKRRQKDGEDDLADVTVDRRAWSVTRRPHTSYGL